MPSTLTTAQQELDRQVGVLQAAHPQACAAADLEALVAPLRPLLDDVPPAVNGLPFVLVVPGLVPPLATVAALALHGRPGFSSMPAGDVALFRPLPDLDLPRAPAYLVVDVDTGRDTLGVAPQDALPPLRAAGRSPLTLEEGLAIALQHPQVLVEHNCFEMLGSRGTDRRVTGLWVMKGGAPRLGWCWVGAPHSWLGVATCGARLG